MSFRRLLCPTLLALSFPVLALPPAALDPRSFDPTVPACTDFYRHANGGWLRSTPVPAGRGSYGLLDQVAEQHRQQRLQQLQALAADPARRGEALADFIASGLDDASLETLGRRDLDALLAPLARLDQPSKQVPAMIAALHARGMPIVFRADVAQLDGGPRLRLLAGGLGLPDRDYYTREDAATRELLGNYRSYVERLLALAGSPDSANEAAWVLDAEMRLARGWPPHGEPAAVSQALPLRELQRRYPAFDWRGWLKAQNLQNQDTLALPHPAFFSELNTLLASGHAVQWRAYLRFHIAHLLAPFLSAEFVAVHDDFFQRVLRGRTQMPTRAERTLEAVERLLGPAFAAAIEDVLLPPPRRQAAERLLAELRDGFRTHVASVGWLPEAERPAALARIDRISIELAQPGGGGTLDGVRFDRQRYAENVLIAATRLQRAQYAALGKRAGVHDERGTPPMAAQYDPRSNKLQLGLALLQPPLFDPADPALTLGGLGALLGHELLHAVDLAGAAWASETPSPERIAAFEAHTAALKAQFDGYRGLGERPLDGGRLLAENAADLAGLELAWSVFIQRGDEAATRNGEHSPAQRFFLGWAQLMRRNYRDEDLLRRLAQEPQAPAEFRVNGPLAQLPEFADAFACPPDAPLRLPAEQRVRILR
jgi:putative endopeptidase